MTPCLLCSYVTGSRRIDHKEDTKLAVDAEEQEALLERMRSGASASMPAYHFICECFFLTAKGLHLGFVKAVQDLYSIARVSIPATPLSSRSCCRARCAVRQRQPMLLVLCSEGALTGAVLSSLTDCTGRQTLCMSGEA